MTHFTESELARAKGELRDQFEWLVSEPVDEWFSETMSKIADALTADWPEGVTVIKLDAHKRIEELEGALRRVMDETGTSSLAHHAARDALAKLDNLGGTE